MSDGFFLSKSAVNSLPGSDNVESDLFENELTVLVKENRQSPSVAFTGYLPCGSFLDPVEKTGLALFTANCLMSGTHEHDFNSIFEMIEACGASMRFSADVQGLHFSGRCLAEDLPKLLSLLREVLDMPEFPHERVEIMRAQLLTGYEIRLHDTDDMAALTFNRALYADHPYGREDGGTKETILRITREDMVEFQRRFFGPAGMKLCIVGGVDAQKTIDQVRSVFAPWNKFQEKVEVSSYFPPVPALQLARRMHYYIPQKTETGLIIGSLGPARKNPLYRSALLGNCILGEFGMMGRIGNVVRDENGLAYYAGSSINCLREGGSWVVNAGVNTANVDKALELIHQELVRFVNTPVDQDELENVKSFYIGSLPLSLESNAGMAGAILTTQTYDLGLDYFHGLESSINAVTADSIMEAARTFIDPDKMLTVTAGSAQATV